MGTARALVALSGVCLRDGNEEISNLLSLGQPASRSLVEANLYVDTTLQDAAAIAISPALPNRVPEGN